jgi:hypothetical protein
MATPLTYFTAKLWYPVVVADEPSDADYDPQVEGPMAGATITAHVVNPPPSTDDVHANEIPAADLSPTAGMLILAPIDCRLNAGHLCLRVAADLPVHSYTSAAAFPAIGTVDHLFWAADVDKMYEWVPSGPSAGGYLEVESFTPVRLVAQTPVLQLPTDAFLVYEIAFDHVTYNGADQTLPGFVFKAPTADVELDLATAERVVL